MTRARLALTRLGLALGATLATLLVAELVARAVGFDATPRPYSNAPVNLVPVEDPVLRFENQRSASFEYFYPYGDGREPLVVRGSTNAQGFRGPELPLEHGAALRIACVGDSYTFGEGVEDDGTWPAQLAVQLAQLRPQSQFEVMNFGVNSYDTRQEARCLESRVLPYAPDLVILSFFLNDAAIRGLGEFAGHEYGRPPVLYRALTTREPFLALRRWSQLFDGLADSVVGYEYLVFLGESRSLMYTQDSRGWRIARDELAHAAQLCRDGASEFLVVLYPLLFRRGEHLASHDAYLTVAQACRELGIATLDLEPAFEGQDVDGLRVHRCDSHPNARGHAIAARAIAAHLVETGLVR